MNQKHKRDGTTVTSAKKNQTKRQNTEKNQEIHIRSTNHKPEEAKQAKQTKWTEWTRHKTTTTIHLKNTHDMATTSLKNQTYVQIHFLSFMLEGVLSLLFI